MSLDSRGRRTVAGAGLARRRIGRYVVVFDEATSRRLARFGHETSGPERTVRRFLASLGMRFRVRNRDLPGSPDIANRSRKWAIFVHGCFWHHHYGCSRAAVPSRNRAFWVAKFSRNRRRDRRVLSQLQRGGFTVGVVWECEVSRVSLLRQRLQDVLRASL